MAAVMQTKGSVCSVATLPAVGGWEQMPGKTRFRRKRCFVCYTSLVFGNL